jgi:sterol 14-demethylase
MDPRVWNKPTEWDPSRWLNTSASSGGSVSDEAGVIGAMKSEATGEKVDYGWGVISKGTESPYQPFGAGRHRCIGESFAYVQLGSIVATMVRAVEMRLPQKMPQHNYHVSISLPPFIHLY